MNKEILTETEKKLWIELLKYYQDNGYMPLRIELARLLSTKSKKISPQLIQYWLRGLEAKGWIELHSLKKRGIKLV